MLLNLDHAQCFLSEYKDGDYYLYSLCVLPEYRNKGFATKLLRAIRKFADRKKVKVYLTAAPFPTRGEFHFNNNIYKQKQNKVIKLYKRMGFKRINKKTYEMVYNPIEMKFNE